MIRMVNYEVWYQQQPLQIANTLGTASVNSYYKFLCKHYSIVCSYNISVIAYTIVEPENIQ